MSRRTNEDEPAVERERVINEARRMRERGERGPGIDLEEPSDRIQEATAPRAAPVAEKTDPLGFLGAARTVAMAACRDKPSLMKIIDWYTEAEEGSNDTKACFYTSAGMVRIPVMQHASVEGQGVLVLMLGAPDSVAFFPPAGAELDFSLSSNGRDVVSKRKMTVLSGPWSMRGFPVAFLMLWESDDRAISVATPGESE